MSGEKFHRRLRDEDPVERIAVEVGKPVNGNRVLAGDRQLHVAVVDAFSLARLVGKGKYRVEPLGPPAPLSG